ncbi:MAG: site-specific integrase [Planctomycetota bacterium]
MARPRVYVVDRGRRGLCLRWQVDGKWKEQKATSQRRGAAEREAADHALRLEQIACKGDPVTWDQFCVQYEDEHIDRTSIGNQSKWACVRKRFQTYLEELGRGDMPLTELSPRHMSGFRARLIKDLPSPASAASYFATFRAGINYAAEHEICPVMPTIRMRGKEDHTETRMRGRAITTEEFERILAVVPSVVGKERASEFIKVLNMYWLGGLRLSEPIQLHTHRLDAHRFVDLYSKKPIASFYRSQKNRKNQDVHIVSDWAVYLRTLDLEAGWICNPINDRGWRIDKPNELGRFISKFGRAAKVVVIPAMDGEPPHYATAQNLRQGFGYRWAAKVMPATLKHLMRHGSIRTTMQFYGGQDAEAAAKAIESIGQNDKPSAELDEVL